MKRSTYRLAMAVLIAALFGACAPAGKPLPHNPSRPWADAFNRGDTAAVAALYTDDALLMPPGSVLVRGKAAIEAQLAQDVGGGYKFEITSLENHSEGGIGYNLGTYRVLGADGAVVDNGKFVEVWKRVGDDWKIHSDIYNSDAPPAAPAPSREGAAPAVTP